MTTHKPRPQGRMIRVDIADDAGLAQLSDGAARLYFYLTPHLTAHGKFAGGAPTMRDNVVPLLGWSQKRILGYLAEINTHTSMKVWKQLGRVFVHDITFSDKQSIKEDRKGRDSVPSYPGPSRLKTSVSPYSLPELVKSYSGVTPPEVEVEVEVEGKEKEEVDLEVRKDGNDGLAPSGGPPSPIDNGKGNGTAKASGKKELPENVSSILQLIDPSMRRSAEAIYRDVSEGHTKLESARSALLLGGIPSMHVDGLFPKAVD